MLSGTPVMHFKARGLGQMAQNCSGKASECGGQRHGPKRNMRMTVSIATGFYIGPLFPQVRFSDALFHDVW